LIKKLVFSGTASLNNISDSIIVFAQDKFNRTAFDTRQINYYNPPIINIVSPKDRAIRIIDDLIVDCASYYSQTGNIVNFYVNSYYQDDYTLELDNDRNIIGLVYLTENENIVEVEITDKFGRISSDTITVYYFESPQIKITVPKINEKIPFSNISISGTSLSTQYGDSIFVYSNSVLCGTSMITSINDTWMLNIKIDTTCKTDTILVAVRNAFGQYGYDTVVFDYYAPPVVKIISPLDKYDTHSMTLIISGTAGECNIGDSIIFYVNNIFQETKTITEIVNRIGVWSASVSIAGIGDSVVVKLIDSFGRNNFDTITANYFITPIIYITSPDKNVIIDTIQKNIILRGTISKANKGGTVVITVDDTFSSDTIIKYSAVLIDSLNRKSKLLFQ